HQVRQQKLRTRVLLTGGPQLETILNQEDLSDRLGKSVLAPKEPNFSLPRADDWGAIGKHVHQPSLIALQTERRTPGERNRLNTSQRGRPEQIKVGTFQRDAAPNPLLADQREAASPAPLRASTTNNQPPA